MRLFRVASSSRAFGAGVFRGAFAFAALVVAAPNAACAQSVSQSDAAPRWREVWAGADASSDVWLVYSGATVAPWSHIHGEGLRFRAVAGYGEYAFEDHFRHRSPGAEPSEFQAQTAFGDLLVGYLWRLDPLILKAFVGVSAITHEVSPKGAATDRQDLAVGPKGVVELWLNMGDNTWGSLDLNWTTAHDTGAARLRTGYRLWPQVSLGPEAGVNSTGEFQDLRGGGFLRYEWEGGEVSISGGVSGNYSGLREGEADPYGTVNWIAQF